MKFDILSVFRKSAEKVQFSLNVARITVLYMMTNIHFWSYLAQFFLEWEFFQTNIVETIKTHFLCLIAFFDSRAFYEIMWKNIVEPGRPQVTVWLMRIACCVPKAANTHSEYVILTDFPLRQRFNERDLMLRYTLPCYFSVISAMFEVGNLCAVRVHICLVVTYQHCYPWWNGGIIVSDWESLSNQWILSCFSHVANF
jgi:hypothetical protein